MADVFVSYRREDSDYAAGRIRDSLQTELVGEHDVVRDYDFVIAGRQFEPQIQSVISRCEVMLVVIGERWATERLFAPDDVLRREIEHALLRHISIVPVLAGSASMPAAASVPESIRSLTSYQAVRVRPGSEFPDDVRALAQTIRTQIAEARRRGIAHTDLTGRVGKTGRVNEPGRGANRLPDEVTVALNSSNSSMRVGGVHYLQRLLPIDKTGAAFELLRRYARDNDADVAQFAESCLSNSGSLDAATLGLTRTDVLPSKPAPTSPSRRSTRVFGWLRSTTTLITMANLLAVGALAIRPWTSLDPASATSGAVETVPVARGDQPPPAARVAAHATGAHAAERAYADARAAYASGDLMRALDSLSLAYQLSGRPELLFNLGQTARELALCHTARAYYQRYLAAVPGSEPERGTDAREHIAALDARCPPERR